MPSGGSAAGAAPTTARAPAATASPVAAPTAVAPAASAAPPPLSPPALVKFGSTGVSTDIGVFIAMDRGYFRDEGIETEFVQFSTGPDLLPALVTGEIHVAGGSANAAFYNAAARGLDLKLVADKGGCWTGTCYYALVVRKDLIDGGQVRDFADLRGKRIAVNSRGVNLMVNLVSALEKGGLTERDADVDRDGRERLPGRAGEPWHRRVGAARAAGGAGRDDGQHRALEGRRRATPLLPAGRRPDVRRQVHQRAARGGAALDGRLRAGAAGLLRRLVHNRDRAGILDLLTKYTNLKDRAVLDHVVLHAANPDGYMNVEGLQADLDVYLQLDVVRQPVDLATVIDHSFVDYAVGRLGRAAR